MKAAFKSFLGIGICFLSSLLICSSNALVKHLDSTNPIVLTCLRFLYIWLIAQPISVARFEKESPFPKGKLLPLFTRGLLGAANTAIKFYAYQVGAETYWC